MEAIRAGGIPAERAANHLYQQWEGYIPKAVERYQMKADLAREAFHLALQKTLQAVSFGQFEGRSKLSTYFHTIFFNRCVDILRRESSYKEKEMEDYMLDLPDAAANILREIQGREDMHRFHQYLDQLGEKCRQLLIQTEWYGKSLKQMAQEMDYASASVAGTSKNRCMQRLKKLMRKDLSQAQA
ncbi:MAG: sigma-70 family RNA polymerase sigma factor [Bacteroidota bacterium]